MKTLLADATIVTMNERREILKGYDLLIENDRISKIAPKGFLKKEVMNEVIDCSGKVIIPGLISAHSHLIALFLRGLWDGDPFEVWRRRTNAMERLVNFSPDDIYTVHCAACIDLIRHGVTTALNFYDLRTDVRLEKVRSAHRALLNTGIRAILAIALQDQSPDNEATAFASTSCEFWIDFAREVGNEVGRLNPKIAFMLAPSAPQRCTDLLLTSCEKLGDELNVGTHIHLSESKRQAEMGWQMYGESTVKHLEKIGFLNKRLSVAHSIWLDDEEIDLLKRYDVKVVHCPASNMKLGNGVAQVKKMLKKGITVALGVDSVNGGTTYSVFEQMKLSVLLPRTLWGPEGWILAQEAFEMATVGGARAMLQSEIIGSLEEGKKADLVVLDPTSSLLPMNDLINQLVLCEDGNSVESVFVDGQPVMLQKRMKTINEADIANELSLLGPRILETKHRILDTERSG